MKSIRTANTKPISRKEEEYKPQAVTTGGEVSVWGLTKEKIIFMTARPPKGLKNNEA